MTNIIIDPFKFGAPALSLTQVLSSSSTSSTITLPADIQAGDLIVLIDYATGSGSTEVLPPGFATLVLVGSGTIRCVHIAYKIATGSEGGTSITGMNEITERKAVIVWRPSRAIVSVSATDADGIFQATSSAPTQQDQNVSGFTTPVVVIALWNSDGTVDPRGMSPAKDGEIEVLTNLHWVGWKTYNSSPQDTAITMQDEGANVLFSCNFQAA